MTFGKMIRLLRIRNSLSQEELASAAGLSRRTVTAYETGRSRPGSMAKYKRLADALGVDIGLLLDGKKPDEVKMTVGDADQETPAPARELYEEARAVFADENLTEADKDLIMHSLQEIYWDIKKEIMKKKDVLHSVAADD
ncbi:MAG: helix-turn-helix domain-containing protein [Clostridia bacterium]|nr:helix-turn-helix domain-containing protein [Clostridia bacterium]